MQLILEVCSSCWLNSLWPSDAIWCHWNNIRWHRSELMCSVVFTWEQVHKKCSWTKPVICVWRLHLKNHCHISQGSMGWHKLCWPVRAFSMAGKSRVHTCLYTEVVVHMPSAKVSILSQVTVSIVGTTQSAGWEIGMPAWWLWVLIYWGREKMAAILQMAFSKALSWMKNFVVWF